MDQTAPRAAATGWRPRRRRIGARGAAAMVAAMVAAGCATPRHGEGGTTTAGGATSTGMTTSTSQQAVASEPILLTIILRHDQSKTLDEIRAHLERTRWHEVFPPEGCQVVSWYVVMGVGQIVTLSVPPDRLRAVNLAVERSAWGAFTSEFHPSYDYMPIWNGSVR